VAFLRGTWRRAICAFRDGQVYAVLALLAARCCLQTLHRGSDLFIVAGFYVLAKLRNSRSSDFLGWAPSQRTHPQTPFCRRRRFLDFKNASEEAADRGSLNLMHDASHNDGCNCSTFEGSPAER